MKAQINQWMSNECTRALRAEIDKDLLAVNARAQAAAFLDHRGGSEFILGQLAILNKYRNLAKIIEENDNESTARDE